MTPLFPGDSEGLQIAEQSCILGTPSDADIKKMSKTVEMNCLYIFSRMPKQEKIDITSILDATSYTKEDLVQCSDLIMKMLRWS
jgi:hypothetical protein